jgi:hypothetical protein
MTPEPQGCQTWDYNDSAFTQPSFTNYIGLALGLA